MVKTVMRNIADTERGVGRVTLLQYLSTDMGVLYLSNNANAGGLSAIQRPVTVSHGGIIIIIIIITIWR
jgi:hypothetical protein